MIVEAEEEEEEEEVEEVPIPSLVTSLPLLVGKSPLVEKSNVRVESHTALSTFTDERRHSLLLSSLLLALGR